MIRDDLRLPTPVHIPHDIEVFAKLDVSPFEFFLAGSRYMGCAREDSDWDFLAQNSNEVRAFLERLGFSPLFEEYPISGGNTVEVFQFVEGDLKVQVQLQHDVQVQRNVRDIIKTYMLAEHIKMDREHRTLLWNGLFANLTMQADQFKALDW